jgi:carboxymethylenebutenolidase
MCHTDVPPGQATPAVVRREVTVPLSAGDAMPALHVGADGAAAVLVVADVFGRSPFYEHLASLLAEAGFQALLPDYFFRQGPLPTMDKQAAFARRAQLDERGTLRDLTAAVEWLRESGSGDVVGLIGFCMGGTLALDLASTADGVAAVAYYGFPAAPPTETSPPRPIDLVEELRGPVLAFWGDQDETVGLDSVKRYVAVAPPGVSHRILPGLGHGFIAAADLTDPDDPATQTWRESVEFLRRHVDSDRS